MKGLYVVRDTLADEYVGQPLFFSHDAAAIRFFGDAVADPKTSLNKYPNDHALWRIGSVDSDTGAFVSTGDPVVVITGAVVVAVREASV